MYPRLATLLTLLLLYGCAASRPAYIAPINSGFTLQINTTFEQLPNATRLNFQHGKRVPAGNLDKWTTWCSLYVYNPNRKADYVTEVIPGELTLDQVRLRYQSVDNYRGPRQLFASFKWDRHERPAYYLYRVSMKLNSPDQPDIKSLTCSKKWATARANKFPDLAEIRSALGQLIELRPMAISAERVLMQLPGFGEV